MMILPYEDEEDSVAAAKRIEAKAHEEIAVEDHREAVDVAKEKLRQHVPLLHRLFPWKITIQRRR